MKLITFTVPCYNSAEYMDKCLKSLLTAGDEAEIIIVDDGSTDETPQIADRYAEQYPGIVRVIHQENGGHGEGMNQGMRNATGLYFKVVDSDDWIDETALAQFLSNVRHLVDSKELPDLIIANYVFERIFENKRHVNRYKSMFPENRTITWDQINHIRVYEFLAMHALYYKTEVVKKSGLVCPKHTFYVDNLVAYCLLPLVNTLHYMDLDMYRYFIGRDDQSVNENVMVKRIDQQIRVTDIMIKSCHVTKEVKSKKQRKYMCHYLGMIITITSLFCMLGGGEDLEKKQKVWDELKEFDIDMYNYAKRMPLNLLAKRNGKFWTRICMTTYHGLNKIFHFN